MTTFRPPAVAGAFYPADARELSRQVAGLLAQGENRAHGESIPKALIVPHAGYVYSGAIAATAYSRLAAVRSIIKRVVLLGPVHRVPIRGLALPGVDVLATPLGDVPVDAQAVALIAALPQVTISSSAHALEHSLEVHLPFLQHTLEAFSVIPLAVGDATPSEIVEVLDLLWGSAETLIVVSSDLSHYLSYEQARSLDRSTAQAIVDLRSDITHEQACGGTPVNGLTLAARRRGLTAKLLDLRNSGDTAGDRRRVVGYGAFAFYEYAVS